MLGLRGSLLTTRNAAARRYAPIAQQCRFKATAVEEDLAAQVAPPRVITAAALFDGHDAAINVMRRLIQAKGVEVIHLGHDRSAQDIVDCAIQEDAQAVALTSYQGGHLEYFKYIKELLDEAGCGHIKIYGGGGGTISPPEIKELHEAGIDKIYSPEDGRRMGLDGMIQELVDGAISVDLMALPTDLGTRPVTAVDHPQVARLLTLSENLPKEEFYKILEKCRSRPESERAPVIGMTGTGGAGKSSLLDELMLRALRDNPEMKICLLCIDPTRKRQGGALLGDRIRMNSVSDSNLYMRSFATRGSNQEVSERIQEGIAVAQAVGFDLVFVETSGIGQGQDAITNFVDHSVYVMTSEFGAETQLEKIEMLDVADTVVLNKFEKRGAEDALRLVGKQVMHYSE
jgi:methylmalonyl-CoA mutase